MIEKLMQVYYRLAFGYYNEQLDKITECTLKYLIDNGYDFKEIVDIMKKSKISDCLRPENLPDILWEGSLLKRDTYYYHSLFHIVSKPPIWNPETLKAEYEPFFKEMRIKFTMKDLLSYYYDKCKIDISLRDEKRDAGAFEYMLNRYHLCGMEGVDFILMLIDEADKNNINITNPLKLQDLEGELLNYLLSFLAEAEHDGVNQIIWRSSNV